MAHTYLLRYLGIKKCSVYNQKSPPGAGKVIQGRVSLQSRTLTRNIPYACSILRLGLVWARRCGIGLNRLRLGIFLPRKLLMR